MKAARVLGLFEQSKKWSEIKKKTNRLKFTRLKTDLNRSWKCQATKFLSSLSIPRGPFLNSCELFGKCL